jgi:L-threonylcarbamoyladenylate synthase
MKPHGDHVIVKSANIASILEAAEVIKHGGLVAFPTETVYGLGADAFNAMSVAKIFETKKRPFFDPLIVHISSIDDLPKLTSETYDSVFLLAEKFWPGPLTIVLPKAAEVPDIVTAGLDTVGIRMPDHKVALDLIRESGSPIAAPSANRFGCISPTSADHVIKQLSEIDYVLDGGRTTIGIESTVILLKGNQIKVLRHGAVTSEEILKAIPCLDIAEELDVINASPGMLKSHYSPEKPLFILGDPLPFDFTREDAALLSFSCKDTHGYKIVEYLTKDRNLREYAVNLFASLHSMEESDVKYIVAEKVPEHGIGMAIMDRLKKAAYRYSKEGSFE